MCLDLPSDLSEFSVTVRSLLVEDNAGTPSEANSINITPALRPAKSHIARQIAERALSGSSETSPPTTRSRRFADHLAILNDALPVDPERAGLAAVDPKDTMPTVRRSFADAVGILSEAIPEKLTFADFADDLGSSADEVSGIENQRCCATARSTGSRCKLKASDGHDRCHLHQNVAALAAE